MRFDDQSIFTNTEFFGFEFLVYIKEDIFQSECIFHSCHPIMRTYWFLVYRFVFLVFFCLLRGLTTTSKDISHRILTLSTFRVGLVVGQFIKLTVCSECHFGYETFVTFLCVFLCCSLLSFFCYYSGGLRTALVSFL